MAQSTLEIAGALFERIESGDPAGVAALYSEDVEVWHNFSNATQRKAENLHTLTGLIASVDQIRYDVKERVALDAERVLQRHDLCCRTQDNVNFTIPACIFITVRAGRIVRIDEYLDSAQANELRKASGRAALGSGKQT